MVRRTGAGLERAAARRPGLPGARWDDPGTGAVLRGRGGLSIDHSALAAVHREVGDFAGITLVASRYGIAVLGALGLATVGPAAGAAAVCLAGAYTAALMEPGGGFALSPGDLDEAVQVLLTHDWAARDAEGGVDPAEHGFDRVARFRAGLLDGPGSCLPRR